MSDPRKIRLQDSFIPAIINAILNGGIAYSGFKGMESIPLTLDLISSQEKTVWGEGVALAFSMGIILSIITAKIYANHAIKIDPTLESLLRQPVFPVLMRIAIANGVSLFGWFVALAVMWQRLIGSVTVSPLMASMLIAVLAGSITIIVQFRTKQALLRPVR